MDKALHFDLSILVLAGIFFMGAIGARMLLHKLISERYGDKALSDLTKFAAVKYRPIVHWVILGCALAPVCEEFVFRLPLIFFIHLGVGATLGALFISSLVFAVCHIFECPSKGIGRSYGLYLCAWTFLHSLILGGAVIATGSIVTAILVHASVNAFVLLETIRAQNTPR